ncbi:hypothetical protein [Streptomyces sp. MMS20-AI2-20]|uniref:hypothetical protein n=1 Tax=Streptomyces sp. MMS20-AI2-20 TaxID=2925835 RepID=UPI001F61C1E6|nr:hypothetical protein [Streptomyces sp. MMS20-AI2-20]MCI4145774.1 hypothetical protein [Streptomyces sp. MMS20-AI2-20]
MRILVDSRWQALPCRRMVMQGTTGGRSAAYVIAVGAEFGRNTDAYWGGCRVRHRRLLRRLSGGVETADDEDARSASEVSQLARDVAQGDGWVVSFGFRQPVMACPGCSDGRETCA